MDAAAEAGAAGEELKPGERKVISDGTDGPVVEIIRRSASEEEAETLVENTDEKNAEAESTGE